MKTTASSERQDVVLDLLLRRDQQGMRHLFHYYGGALLSTIQPIIPEKEVAEEVLHDALLKVWNNVGSYDAGKSRFFTWMARIARNQAIDRRRSKAYRKAHKTDALSPIVGNSERNSTTTAVDHIGLETVLGKLDDNHRRLIELLYLQDYSQSEAAKELGIPLGTVKTRSRRAIQQLRQFLSNELTWLLFLFFKS